MEHKSPSKRQRDRERFRRWSKQREEARFERLRLFGYYEAPDGRRLDVWEAFAEFGRKADRMLVFHQPETFTDYIASPGEVVVPKGRIYPRLGIFEGEVIRDPKIRTDDPRHPCYVHPVLRGTIVPMFP